MFLSIFEVFKIGIGPSSSHTMGPMVAASRFLELIKKNLDKMPELKSKDLKVQCSLHGSLAFTGKGHASDRAVMLGLMGFLPENLDPDKIEDLEKSLQEEKMLKVEGLPPIHFSPDTDIIFDYEQSMPEHPNAMKLMLHTPDKDNFIEETYFSIGGGFVLDKEEILTRSNEENSGNDNVTYPFVSANQMLEMGKKHNKSIAEMKKANELCFISENELNSGLDKIWETMHACINRGLRVSGILPGGLKVNRRAYSIHENLKKNYGKNDNGPHVINDWISLYAIAVNEENAAGGRVVTSPTNGAAGVVPSVFRYYLDFVPGAEIEKVREYFLVGAAIGGIIKHQASISGAEVGCQGEVGSASSMAAAGLCSILGGTNEQIENAAEIALEHHLGMTCDPIAGLVQIPCIERNALGAVKAVTSASLSLRGDGKHFVSLDNCIETMKQTGLDMHEKYKETSQGGLAAFAVNLPSC